ncbi:MAG: N-acetylmuramoyl-L-alanine amidase [Solirubrobacteraceae bacterium]
MRLFYLVLLFILISSCSTLHKKSNLFTEVKIENGIKLEEVVPHYFSAKLDDYEVSEEFLPSKSQNERVRFLILHYTGIDTEASIKALTKNEVSSHYLISDSLDKKIHLLVTEDKRAWHAGLSFFNNFNNLNDNSIGVEIVNKGFKLDSLGNMVFESYPTHQIKKVAILVKNIVDRYKIDSTYVLGHSDIAPQRKFDPGPLFPWKYFYDTYRIGAWYNELDKTEFSLLDIKENFNSIEFITSVQEDLLKYGYEIKITGEWDLQTKNVIRAFQYHFNATAFEFGILDQETWSILKALNKKYRK